MSYQIAFTDKALEEIEKLEKSGDLNVIKNKILADCGPPFHMRPPTVDQGYHRIFLLPTDSVGLTFSTSILSRFLSRLACSCRAVNPTSWPLIGTP